MNELTKTDNIKQPAVTVFGVGNDAVQNVLQSDVVAQHHSHTVVADGKDIAQPAANKVRDKAIESRQAVISAVCDDKAKKIQDVKKISHSERLEELKKCTIVGAKIITGAVLLVFVGAGLMAVVKNAGNIFHAVDGIFESVSTALANIAGRLTSKQSVQQSNVIGSVINEMKAMTCSDSNKDVTMQFLQSAGGKLCKKIDLGKLCDVAKKASILNEKFGINSYDQNALAGLKFKLLQCITNKKSNCKESLDVLNGIKNRYFANECLEAVAASEIGKSIKSLDDKDLVKNGILYELITNASNIAGFFTKAKNVMMYSLIAMGIPSVSVFSKTFFNVIKTVYNFFKK